MTPDSDLKVASVVGQMVACPVCGDECSRVRSVIANGRGSHGGAAVIKLQGEPCGHDFAIVVEYDKGRCYVRVKVWEQRRYERSCTPRPETEDW